MPVGGRKPIGAGRLRHHVTVRSFSNDPDSPGWSDRLTDLPARIEPLRGRELQDAQASGAESRYKVTLRAAPAVTTGEKLVHAGTSYIVDEVLVEPDERQVAYCHIVA